MDDRIDDSGPAHFHPLTRGNGRGRTQPYEPNQIACHTLSVRLSLSRPDLDGARRT
jgi:hypothetical protein